MRLLLAALTLTVALAGTSFAQSPDLRAPDQQSPAAQPEPTPPDLRAPDQQAPIAPGTEPTVDMRAPDQQAPLQQVATPPAPAADGGTDTTLVLVLVGAGIVLLAGLAYVGLRFRRVTAEDDLIAQ